MPHSTVKDCLHTYLDPTRRICLATKTTGRLWSFESMMLKCIIMCMCVLYLMVLKHLPQMLRRCNKVPKQPYIAGFNRFGGLPVQDSPQSSADLPFHFCCTSWGAIMSLLCQNKQESGKVNDTAMVNHTAISSGL